MTKPPEHQLVAQCDREAASALMLEIYGDRLFGDSVRRGEVLDGKQDRGIFVQAFARHRLNTPSPGTILNECIAELGDTEPFVVSRDGDGWAVRQMSAWRVLQPEASERAAIVALLYKHMPPMPGPKPETDRDIHAVKEWWYRAAKRSAWHSAIMLIERGDHLTQYTEDKTDG